MQVNRVRSPASRWLVMTPGLCSHLSDCRAASAGPSGQHHQGPCWSSQHVLQSSAPILQPGDRPAVISLMLHSGAADNVCLGFCLLSLFVPLAGEAEGRLAAQIAQGGKAAESGGELSALLSLQPLPGSRSALLGSPAVHAACTVLCAVLHHSHAAGCPQLRMACHAVTRCSSPAAESLPHPLQTICLFAPQLHSQMLADQQEQHLAMHWILI